MAVRSALRRDVEQVLDAVRASAPKRTRPALVVLAGLPGSGKSHLTGELRERTGAIVLESDQLRRLLFREPTHGAEESRQLFAAIHAAAEALLSEGASVVLDATNLIEAERAPLYEVAERAGANMVLVQVTAPDRLIRRRLGIRSSTGESHSDANAGVYLRMRRRVEPIQRPHFVVDTSEDSGPLVAAIVKEMNQS